MRNAVGVTLAALGVGLVAFPWSFAVACVLTGLLLLVGSVFTVIDWTGR